MAELFHPSLPPTQDAAAAPPPADTLAEIQGAETPGDDLFSLGGIGSDLGTPARPAGTQVPAQRFGKFELLEAIAAGGMGVVFKARDTNLNRLVALKVMKNSILPDPEEVRRFNREVKAAAQLAHPYIVPIYEFGELRGVPYFTMELGETNFHRWRLANRDPAALVAVIEKVARAVQFAHEQGVVHRDLKPGNILMSKDGEPRLADFGLVKLEGSSINLTASSAMLGTPPYMAPEQIRTAKESHKSADIWALGVILYEVLTGRLPFQHDELPQLFRQIQFSSPSRPRGLRKEIDPGLERIILRCLEKEPEERYPSAAALADDLARWQRGEAVRRDRWEWISKQFRRVRRHPKTAAAITLGLLLLGLGINFTRDYLDDQRALRPAMAALARGEKVTLIGETGGPLWYREVVGKAEMYPSNRTPLEIKTMGACILELYPGPLPTQFRLEAEVLHEKAANDSEIGIFISRVSPDTVLAVEHSILAFTISDSPGATSENVTAEVSHRRHPQPKRDHPFGQSFVQLGLQVQASRPKADRHHHHLMLEVAGDDLTYKLDGVSGQTAMGTIGPRLMLAQRTMAAQPDFNPEYQPLATLRPQAGLGIYLRHGVASVRNVFLSPLSLSKR